MVGELFEVRRSELAAGARRARPGKLKYGRKTQTRVVGIDTDCGRTENGSTMMMVSFWR